MGDADVSTYSQKKLSPIPHRFLDNGVDGAKEESVPIFGHSFNPEIHETREKLPE